jgi:hypothetical protein
MKKPAKAIRLTYELDAIDGAIRAAWMLADGLTTHQLGEATHFEQAPKAIAGVLALVSARLELLGSVLRGSRQPEALWAPHNQADEEEADDRDVLPT